MPSVLEWVRSAIDAGLDSSLMLMLNYEDLKLMVIEYRIREKEIELVRFNQELRGRGGVTFKEATQEDIDNL